MLQQHTCDVLGMPYIQKVYLYALFAYFALPTYPNLDCMIFLNLLGLCDSFIFGGSIFEDDLKLRVSWPQS